MKNDESIRNEIRTALDSRLSSVVEQPYSQQKMLRLIRGEEKIMKKKFSTGFVLVMSLMLLSAIALAVAQQYDYFGFLNERGQIGKVLPETSSMIEKNVEQTGGETDLCTFKVRETMIDGNNVSLIVSVTPKANDILLVGPGMTPDDPMSILGSLYADSTQSLKDYADQNGKRIVSLSLYDQNAAYGLPSVIGSLDYLAEVDGAIALMTNGSYDALEDAKDLTLHCVATPWEVIDGSNWSSTYQAETELSIALSSAEPRYSISFIQGADYPSCGVHIDSISMISSATATRMHIHYTVIDAQTYEKMDDGLWFEMVDENGIAIDSGDGSVTAVEGNTIKYEQQIDFAAMEKLPTSISLRAYECWNKQRFETNTFTAQ